MFEKLEHTNMSAVCNICRRIREIFHIEHLLSNILVSNVDEDDEDEDEPMTVACAHVTTTGWMCKIELYDLFWTRSAEGQLHALLHEHGHVVLTPLDQHVYAMIERLHDSEQNMAHKTLMRAKELLIDHIANVTANLITNDPGLTGADISTPTKPTNRLKPLFQPLTKDNLPEVERICMRIREMLALAHLQHQIITDQEAPTAVTGSLLPNDGWKCVIYLYDGFWQLSADQQLYTLVREHVKVMMSPYLQHLKATFALLHRCEKDFVVAAIKRAGSILCDHLSSVFFDLMVNQTAFDQIKSPEAKES